MQWEDMRIASREEVLAFDQTLLRSAEKTEGLELEASFDRRFIPPRFVTDLSVDGHKINIPEVQSIHSSHLVQRNNVMLFGPSNVVSQDGVWNAENRMGRGTYLHYMKFDFYSRLFPGDSPQVDDIHTQPRITTAGLAESQAVRWVDEPVFLATPLEPPIWGRWVGNVIPRVRHFMRHGQGRKFLCHVDRPWERQTLNSLGIPDEQIIPHEPGRAYLCRDIMFVEYDGQALAPSLVERALFNDTVAHNRVDPGFGKKLFVSRVTATKKNPMYRPLLNEAEAIELMTGKGFSVIEPELLPIAGQISAFRNADVVVVVGGSAMFNCAFCRPGTKVVTIEASPTFIATHMEYLSALDMDYGVIFGQQDPEDTRPHHRRWTLDVQAAWNAIESHWPDAGE